MSHLELLKFIGIAYTAPKKRSIYVTGSGKRDNFGQFFKIELLAPQGRVSPRLCNMHHSFGCQSNALRP